jgi:hypothetical protein
MSGSTVWIFAHHDAADVRSKETFFFGEFAKEKIALL